MAITRTTLLRFTARAQEFQSLSRAHSTKDGSIDTPDNKGRTPRHHSDEELAFFRVTSQLVKSTQHKERQHKTPDNKSSTPRPHEKLAYFLELFKSTLHHRTTRVA